jgi:hypothetical protein
MRATMSQKVDRVASEALLPSQHALSSDYLSLVLLRGHVTLVALLLAAQAKWGPCLRLLCLLMGVAV